MSCFFDGAFAAATVWRDQAGHDVEVCVEGNALDYRLGVTQRTDFTSH
jgi:hypothetical protein